MFYDIPRVSNMVAVHQLDFIGKTVCGPSDRPAQQMLTAYCDHVQRVGRLFLHNKDFMVKNLCLLFANVPEVTNDDYGSLENWIKDASNEQYWTQLMVYLIDRQSAMPARPDKWSRLQQSPRNHDAPAVPS